MKNTDVEHKLQKLIDKIVKSDKHVKNAVLAVSTGDGEFNWSSAAGMADPEENRIMTVDTPVFIASITKMFTATVVMLLFEKNKLKLDAPMSDYLPSSMINRIHVYAGKDYTDQVLVRHLLSHTSGIPDYYTKAPENKKSFFEILISEPDRIWTVEDTVAFARDNLKPEFAPGEKASYADTNFQLLGFIIESVTGQSLHDVYKELIFKPLGMKHTYLYTRSKPIDPNIEKPAHFFFKNTDLTNIKAFESSWADGGIVSTVDDCLVFIKAFNTGTIFSNEDTGHLMRDWKKLQKGMYYGFGTMHFVPPELFFLLFSYPNITGHFGSIGSFLFYCEKLDIYIAGTMNQGKSASRPFRVVLKVINLIRKFEKEKNRNSI